MVGRGPMPEAGESPIDRSRDTGLVAIAARLCREEAARMEELGSGLGDALADGGLLSHDVIRLLQECDRIGQTLADISRLLDHATGAEGWSTVSDQTAVACLRLERVREAVLLARAPEQPVRHAATAPPGQTG